MRGPRVRAPELTARGGWLNVDAPLSLADLRGKVVLLDFWTFACVNCLHVIDELRPLEDAFADVLVTVGVHSPKFTHEADHAAVAAAVERYDVRHPVLDDPDMSLWRQYAVKAWPTLTLLDPEGYVVAQLAGEGHAAQLERIVAALVDEHERKGTLRRGPRSFRPSAAGATPLRFPAKAIALPDALLVADAGHHQLVRTDLMGTGVLARIGSGERGLRDGAADVARFAEPGGLTLLPHGVAPFDVVVADTGNHVLRGVRSADGTAVATIDLAAALTDARTVTGAVPDVLSPWDVAWWPARRLVVVAAAGVHLLLGWHPDGGRVEILAGTTVEGLRDGPALDGWLAQPSGLAVDGDRVWFVDAETSALRFLTSTGELHTAVGQGLFEFGLVDGPAGHALFQHPLGVTLQPDRSLAVLDTFNGAVRRYDPARGLVSTLATGLREPSGAVVVAGELLVVESAAHRIAPLRAEPVVEPARAVDETVHLPAEITLEVLFTPGAGRKLDDRDGPSTRLTVTAEPAEAIGSGAGTGTDLTRTIRFAGDTTLHVTAQAAECDDDPTIEYPACHVARRDWAIRVRVEASAKPRLTLVLPSGDTS